MIAELWSAPCLFFAGYIAVDSVKCAVGLVLMIAHKDRAFAWWEREVIGP